MVKAMGFVDFESAVSMTQKIIFLKNLKKSAS